MDPNIIIIRLGAELIGEIDGSGPLSSVTNGDTFAVNFKRADFDHKRDAMNHSELNRDTAEQFYQSMMRDIAKKQQEFDQRF